MFGLAPLPRTLSAALRDIGHKKVSVRLSAVRDLVPHAAGAERGRVVSALESALIDDASAEVRAQAAVALADANAGESTAALVGAYEDAHLRVRQMALVALGEVGSATDSAACDVVDKALSHEAPALRFQALIGACRLMPERAPRALLEAMHDADSEVRHIAIRLAEERWLGDGDGDKQEPPPSVLSAVHRRLDDSALSVRLAAAIFIGRCGDDAGRAVLAEAVGRNGGRLDPVDEHAAIELCGVLNIEEARASLARRGLGLGRDPFSWHCRVALARLGDDRARAAILKGLAAWTRDTRTHAVAAAGQAGLTEAEPRLRTMADNPEDAEPDAVREALRLLAVARDSTASTRQ